MKAKFINVDTITLSPEGEEEKMIFDRFVKLIQSKKYDLSNNGAVYQDEHYISIQIGITEKVNE